MSEQGKTDEQNWLMWQRSDIVRILRDRGWGADEAKTQMEAVPDEVFQIIRAQAVNELAECYIVGMRATIRIREALKYATGLMPDDTPRSIEAKRARAESLARFSRVPNQPDGSES